MAAEPVRNHSAEPPPRPGRVGLEVDTGFGHLALQPGQREGRKFVEAEFSLEIPGQATAPVSAVWLAGLDRKGDAELAPESPFGMGVYLNRYGGDARGQALMERAASLARAPSRLGNKSRAASIAPSTAGGSRPQPDASTWHLTYAWSVTRSA